jgi:hypothetical protein
MSRHIKVSRIVDAARSWSESETISKVDSSGKGETMKTITVKEFKDLTPEQQEKAKDACINENVEFYLDCLSSELEREKITEEEFCTSIGCSKHYGESTPWFVGSVYYEHNKELVDNAVEAELKEAVYNSFGTQLFGV